MKSAELAALAGVTVRTLRHYHHLGILAEPTRQTNGYRRYGLRDLIRVLRIKHLSAAGVPLQATAAMLDRGEETGDIQHLLDAIDQDLAQRIAHLTAQRALIAAARASGTTPDLPAELSRLLSVLAASGPPEVVASSHDQFVLLAHLTGAEDQANVTALFSHLHDPALWPRLLSISQQFETLTADSGAEEIEAVVAEFRTFLTGASRTFATWTDTSLADTRLAALVETYRQEFLNPAQRLVLARLADAHPTTPQPTEESPQPRSG